MKRLVIGMLVIGSISGAVGIVAWHRLSRLSPEIDPQRYWQEAGQRAFAAMATAPFSDVDAVQNAILQAPIDDTDGLIEAKGASIEELRETAAGFIATRFNAVDPEAYIAWMHAQGYAFKSAAEFEKRYGPLRAVAEWAGAASNDPRTVFTAMWDHRWSRTAMPDALCVDEGSTTICVAETNHNRFMTRRPSGVLGHDIWHGASGATCRFWMRPPVTREEIVESRGRAIAAQVGMIVSVPGEGRRPIIINMFHDPSSGRWWIDGVSVTNFLPRDDRGMCVEY